MCLTRFAHLDLKFPFFYRNMHIATCTMRAVCILRCNIDSFSSKSEGFRVYVHIA